MRLATGTRTSSKVSDTVSLARWPILFSCLPTVRPEGRPSTTKQVMPLCLLALSTVANTVNCSAWPPLVMKHLEPLRT